MGSNGADEMLMVRLTSYKKLFCLHLLFFLVCFPVEDHQFSRETLNGVVNDLRRTPKPEQGKEKKKEEKNKTMGKPKKTARALARAEARKNNKAAPTSEKKGSFGLVGIVLVVAIALVAGFYVGKEMKKEAVSEQQQGKRVFGVEEKIDFSKIPEVFVLDVCRFRDCTKLEVKKGEGFEKAVQQIRQITGVQASNLVLVNQTGAQIQSLSGLYSASEEKGEERGLGATWRGVRLLIDDEKFFWPLPKNGEGRNASDFGEKYVHFMSDGHRVEVKPLFDSPRVYEITNFLTEEECNHLIGRARKAKKDKKFVDSSVGGDDSSKTKSEVRTSTQTWVGPAQSNDDEVFARVRTRASEFLGIGLDLAEDTQVVHYSQKQQYLGHHDYTPAASIPGNKYFAAGGNRVATLLYYLNDVPEGGDTRFPYAQDTPPYPPEESHRLYSSEACTTGGMKVQPSRGKAILFYSLLEDGHMQGAVDPTSLHAACPAGVQEKWLANQWFRNKRVYVDGKWHLYDNIW